MLGHTFDNFFEKMCAIAISPLGAPRLAKTSNVPFRGAIFILFEAGSAFLANFNWSIAGDYSHEPGS